MVVRWDKLTTFSLCCAVISTLTDSLLYIYEAKVNRLVLMTTVGNNLPTYVAAIESFTAFLTMWRQMRRLR